MSVELSWGDLMDELDNGDASLASPDWEEIVFSDEDEDEGDGTPWQAPPPPVRRPVALYGDPYRRSVVERPVEARYGTVEAYKAAQAVKQVGGCGNALRGRLTWAEPECPHSRAERPCPDGRACKFRHVERRAPLLSQDLCWQQQQQQQQKRRKPRTPPREGDRRQRPLPGEGDRRRPRTPPREGDRRRQQRQQQQPLLGEGDRRRQPLFREGDRRRQPPGREGDRRRQPPVGEGDRRRQPPVREGDRRQSPPREGRRQPDDGLTDSQRRRARRARAKALRADAV